MRASVAKTAVCTLLLTAALVPGLANAHVEPGDFVWTCGRVVNAVGWPVPDVRVRAVGNGLASVRDNHLPSQEDDLTTLTDEEGRFELLLRRDSQLFVLADTRDATDPVRAGAAYAPTTVSRNLFRAPAALGACPEDRAGHALEAFVLASPGQGFVEATAKDGAVKGQPPLADVDVSFTATFTGAEDVDPDVGVPDRWWLHAHTNGTGVARLACQSPGPDGTPYAILFTSGDHLDAQRAITCAEGRLASVDVLLWRRPLALVVHATNATDAAEMPGRVPAQTGVRMPVEGAALAVSRVPSDLGSFAAGSPLCRDAQPDVPVSLSNASPYVCANVTDATGATRLALPWTGDAEGYELAATAAGYATTRTQQVVTAWDAVGFGVAPPRLVPLQLLPPGGLVLTHAVLDANGTGIAGATVTLDGGHGETQTVTAEGGAFSLALSAGPYDVHLEADGFNARTCQIRVAGSNGVAALSSVTPPHCFRLLKTGNALVTGIVRDDEKDLPIPDIAVCSFDSCTRSTATGEFFLDVPAGVGYSVQTSAATRWALATARAGTAPEAEAAASLGTLDLARKTTPVQVRVHELTPEGGIGQPISGADVVIKRGAAVKTPTTGNKTDAAGSYVVPLAWSTNATLPGIGFQSYEAFVTRHNADVHYASVQASVAFDLLDTELEKEVYVLVAREGNVSIAVSATDAHTGQPLAARVTLSPVTAQPNLACGLPHECTNTTPGNVFAYPGHVYSWCVELPGYVKECANRVALPDQPFAKPMRRNVSAVAVSLVDAHTGLPVGGVMVNATIDQPGFGCNVPTTVAPANTYVCDAKTDAATGVVTLNVPWSAPAKTCFSTPVATATVVILPQAGAAPEAQERVGFQAARGCYDSNHQNKLAAVTLKPLRERAPAVTGIVENASGDPLPEAVVVRPKSDREGFVCDPAAHNTTGGSFDDCDGVSVEEGAFSLVLPNGGVPQHLWNLTANATGFFDETYTHVGNMSGRAQGAVPYGALPHPFVLWTKSFPVTVRVVEEAPGSGPCELYEGESLYVTLTDVETGRASYAQAYADEDGCAADVVVQDWNRDPRPLPAFVGPWPKDASNFVIELVSPSRAGASFARLGPAATEVEVRSAKPPGSDPDALPTTLAGRVLDANASTVEGVGGARLIATRVGGACPGTTDTFHGYSRVDGAYTLPVGCAGEYDVSIEHSALYEFEPVRVAVLAGSFAPADIAENGVASVERDFEMTRVAASLAFTAYELDTELPRPTPGVSYVATGVDVATGTDPVTTGADGTATLHGLAWGVYLVDVSGPSGHVLVGSKVPVLVMPGQANAYATFSFRP